MQLPAVSTEEQVMQFLSTVPYNEKLSKSAPKRNLPAITSAPKCNLPAIQPQQQEQQYAQTQRKNLLRGMYTGHYLNNHNDSVLLQNTDI